MTTAADTNVVINLDPFALRPDLQHIPMCRPSKGFKPFQHEWAYEATKKQQQIHWMPEEITMGYDARDYQALEPAERHLIDNILKLFTQADIDVANNYMTLYQPIFRNYEIGTMLRAFAAMEDIHVRAYSLLLETLGFSSDHYNAFLDVEEMRAKHDLLTGYRMRDPKEIAATLALVGGFGEGLQLFSSFAMLLNFSSNLNKMKGMGQVVSWSIRDETLHVAGITKLFHEFRQEAGIDLADVKEEILQGASNVVMLEDAFIDRAFEMGAIRGCGPDDMKQYIRYTADRRLEDLGFDPVYKITDHPLGWLENEINSVELANFFETRATEYSKGATTGEWSNVWDRYDDQQRQKAAA